MRFPTFAILAALTALGLYKARLYARQDQNVLTEITSGSLWTDDDWDFNKRPATNSTSHLVFDTINSLLQRWPNTRYRNGHTFVPGTIPTGTLLYHGNMRKHIPPGPEWLAMDPEHSLMFCLGSEDTGCWQLTLAATRPLSVLYFDGNGAAKMPGGPMDAQDVFLWGEVKPSWAMAEEKRICELCAWGKEFGLDGFVRMEMGFELMLCNFTSGVETVSFLNLVSSDLTTPHPLNDDLPPTHPCDVPPPPDQIIQPSNPPVYGPRRHLFRNEFNTIDAGSWHNHHPGDIRIKLDFTRLISLYDRDLFPSLANLREGKERWNHRLEGISADDAQQLRKQVENVVKSGTREQTGSGIDWKALFQTIVDRYGERLELHQHILENSVDSAQAAKRAYSQLMVMLAPYTLLSAKPSLSEKDLDHAWAQPVYKLCTTTHTSPLIVLPMTQSEKLLLGAVQGVNKEICRVIVEIWAEVVESGLGQIQVAPVPHQDVHLLVQTWKKKTDVLMEWLDWSTWYKCKPACTIEEICYLPTWPFFRGPDVYGSPSDDENPDDENPDVDTNWRRPQPICIGRLEPFDGLLF